MPQIKVFWGFKYLSEFGVILRVCFGCLMCCFVRLFSHVPLPVFLTHAIQLAQSVGSCVEFETLWPQALLIHCYGVSSCASEHSPPCCFCFLSLYSHMPFPMRPSIDIGGLGARCYPNYGCPCWSLFKESACLDDVLIFRTGGRVRIRTIEAEETESWSLEGRLLITRLKSQS